MKKLVIVLILMLLVSCGKEVVIESRGVAPPTATPTVAPVPAPLGGVPTWRREDTPERACPIATELLALSRVQGDFVEECLAFLHKKNLRVKECIDICVRQ